MSQVITILATFDLWLFFIVALYFLTIFFYPIGYAINIESSQPVFLVK